MSSAETVSTSFRVSKEKIERIDAIAASMGRSRNWLLNKALDDILKNAEKQLDAANGIDSGVMGLASAMANLTSAINTLAAERAAQDLATSATAASRRRATASP